jgi:hypothetical protein
MARLSPCPVQEGNAGFKRLMKMEKKGRWAASLGAPVACEMPENHRNRFIRLGLYWGMRYFFAFLILISAQAQAMNLKDFNAQPGKEQSAYIATFIDKMTTDLREKNPDLAQNIRTWFAQKREGKPSSEGMERLFVELTAIELQAKDGKADLSKIQLESVIVYLVKQKFPPTSK